MRILGLEDEILLNQVTRVIDGIVDEVIEKFAPGRFGVYCTIADEDGDAIFTIRCGSNSDLIPNADRIRYYDFSLEKATRLGWYPEHLTSRESMDEELAQYPGATRISGDRIISTSGLSPARLDELVDIKVARAVGRYLPGVMTRIHDLCRPS